MDWMDPEYEVGPNQVVGLNVSTSECHDMIDRFMRTQPEGSRLTMELIPVSAEDSAGSVPVIKGLDKWPIHVRSVPGSHGAITMKRQP